MEGPALHIEAMGVPSPPDPGAVRKHKSRCRLLVYEATLPIRLAELHYPLVFSEPPFQRAFWDVLQRIIQNDK